MKTLVVLSALGGLLLFSMVGGGYICKDPRPYLGTWRNRSDGHECTSLVKNMSGNLADLTTHSWVRGVPVREYCSTIAQWTAIATFLGPSDTYNAGSREKQHAAIFDTCVDEPGKKGIYENGAATVRGQMQELAERYGALL